VAEIVVPNTTGSVQEPILAALGAIEVRVLKAQIAISA
jgi:hypothetical protein